MSGNVFEWTWDWGGPYATGVFVDPTGPVLVDGDRILRGGGWDFDASYCAVAYRDNIMPHFRSFYVGFRVVSR